MCRYPRWHEEPQLPENSLDSILYVILLDHAYYYAGVVVFGNARIGLQRPENYHTGETLSGLECESVEFEIGDGEVIKMYKNPFPEETPEPGKAYESGMMSSSCEMVHIVGGDKSTILADEDVPEWVKDQYRNSIDEF